MIDITMTSVLRPKVLEETLISFSNNLLGDLSNYRLIINIDPVGEDIDPKIILNDVVYKFFSKDNVVYNIPEEPHFGKGFVWCLNNIKSKYVFHLEDDWKLLHKANMNDLIEVLDNNANVATIRLVIVKPKYMKGSYKNNKSKYYVLNNKLSLNPCLGRKDFMKGLVKVMDPNLNPELQVIHAKPQSDLWKYNSRWKHVVYNNKNNPLVKNIGNLWKIKQGFRRGRSAFTTWTQVDKEG